MIAVSDLYKVAAGRLLATSTAGNVSNHVSIRGFEMKRVWMLYAACLLTLFLASPAAGADNFGAFSFTVPSVEGPWLSHWGGVALMGDSLSSDGVVTQSLTTEVHSFPAQVKTSSQSSSLAQSLFSSNPFSIAILDSRFGENDLARGEEDMRITLPAAESHTLVLLGLGLIGFAGILRWRIARTSTGRAK